MRALAVRLRSDNVREVALVADWPEPEGPKGNQIKTQTLYSGITNGTERNNLIRGNYSAPDRALPSVVGYQNVGRVIEVGPEVKTLSVGDVLYMSVKHMEYFVMPEDGLLIKLPDAIDPEQAALFGVSGVAMRTCRNADIRMGERVLVIGAGVVGQTAAQIAAVMGGRVTICDIDDSRLKVAKRIGAAEEVLNVSGDGWERNIPQRSFDVLIDVAGVPGMEDKLIAAVRQRGRVMFIAGRSQVSYNFNQGQGREITIKQNSHLDRGDLANLCRLVARGMVKMDPLIRDVVPVSEAGRIYDILRDKPGELHGTVFVW